MKTIEFKKPDGTPQKHKLILDDAYVPTPLPGRDEWLAALRSGKFMQSTGFLCSPRGYCCLGVLCEVSKEQKTPLREGDEHYPAWRFGPPGDGSVKILPAGSAQYRVLDAHGKFPVGAYLEYPDQLSCPTVATNLTTLNDMLILSFAEIAEIAEQVWSHAPLQTYEANPPSLLT